MAGNRKATGLNVYTVQEATNAIAQRKQIIVTPTIYTSAVSTGDVILNSVEIPNAVLTNGGCSVLRSIGIVDFDDDNRDLTFIFTQNSATIAALGEPADISAPNLRTANCLGAFFADRSDIVRVDLGVARVSLITPGGGEDTSSTQVPNDLPLFLQAASDSTSVYLSLISTANQWAADDLEFHFNIEY